MIERRFVFRGRWSERERYRRAWDKLTIRVRILGSVQVAFNDSKQIFEAPAHLLKEDRPTDAIQLIIDMTKPARISRWPVETIQIVVDNQTTIRRKIRPKLQRDNVLAAEPFFSVLMLATADNDAQLSLENATR